MLPKLTKTPRQMARSTRKRETLTIELRSFGAVIDGLCLSDGPLYRCRKPLEEYMFRSLAECRKRIGLSRIVKQAD